MKRKLALLATIVLSVQLVLSAIVPVAAASAAPKKAVVPSIVHEDIEGDLLKGAGSCDKMNILMSFAEGIKTKWIEDENGGYLEGEILPKEYSAYKFSPGVEIPAGKYLITFYVRTVYEGTQNLIYPQAYDADGKRYNIAVVGVTDKWFKVETYVEFTAPLSYINFRGGMPVESIVPYCIDEISIVPVKRVKDNPGSFGANVTEADIKKSFDLLQSIDSLADYPKWNPNEDYKVEGLMLNLDNTMHEIQYAKSEQDAIDWANQFKGTHVTDMVMNFAESKCVYPTEVFFGWYGDPYTKMENGRIIEANQTTDVHNMSNNHYFNHYKVLGLDYLKTLTKALPDAGVNMWLSIRMNDAHDRTMAESSLFTRYFFEHPEFRRVQYDSRVNGYYAKIWDYSFPEIREKYLALVNESLDRYDVYGFQFEWQREMWLFHPGGEYAGIEIMNQFYRDADAIISVYEEKYGHPIKFSSTVAPELQTNYDFGLDIMTWASEGIIDMLVPMGRFGTTCNETPVALWKSLLDPYGIEVAPCIEAGISTGMVDRQQLTYDHFAGAAALYLSQGADKIQLHNVVPALNYRVKDNQKLAVYDQATLTSAGVSSWWSLFTSLGSYEKLMDVATRKVIPTYNDVNQTWKSNALMKQFPVTVTLTRTNAIRIGMGDIPEGAKATLKFTANPVSRTSPPTVYVNSVPCTYVGIQEPETVGASDIVFSDKPRYIYEIPEAVHGDMWAVVEVYATKRPGFNIDYAEIVIEPAK